MSDFERAKSAINLADYIGQYAPMKRAGASMTCRCPLPGHDDKHPSFNVKGDRWECFGKCGVGGDVFDFAQRYHGWTKAESLIELARYAGITLEPLSPEHKAKQDRRERLYDLLEMASQFYQTQLLSTPQGRIALDYLIDKRGLNGESIETFRVGYAPVGGVGSRLRFLGYSNLDMVAAGIMTRKDDEFFEVFRKRITFPVFDQRGRVVGFTARTLDEVTSFNPKFKNSPECDIFHKGHNLYGISRQKGANSSATQDKVKVIVEGAIDVISGHMRGFRGIYACMGVGMSEEQLALLCSSGVTRLVFCLDNDAAGHTALRRLVEKHMHTAADKGVDLYAMTVPHGKDADDTLREKPELWQGAVDAARPVVDVLLERESASLPKDPTPGHKQVWGLKVLPLLRGSNGFVNEDNVKRLASFLGSSIETIAGWADKQIHVLPKHINAPMRGPQYPNLPTVELKVLHGILVNEDPQRWLDRANIILSKMPYEKACGPLSADDFTSKPTRDLMLIILEMAKRERPFDGLVAAHIGAGPLSEVYYRATCTPEVQAVFAASDSRPPFVQSHDEFLRDVYRLRALRLKADVTHNRIDKMDLSEWVRARMYLEQLAQKGWVLI